MIRRNASLCKWGALLQIPAREPRTSITRRQRILLVRTHRLHYKQRKAEQLGLFSPKELPSFFNLMSQNKLEINYYCLGIIQLRSYNAALKKKNPSNASIISHSSRQNYSHCGSAPFQSHSTCLSFMLITSLYFIKVCMHDVFRSSSSVSLHQKLSPSHTLVYPTADDFSSTAQLPNKRRCLHCRPFAFSHPGFATPGHSQSSQGHGCSLHLHLRVPAS